MRRLTRLAPLAAGVWNRAPQWLRGAVTWAVTGKVIVGVTGVLLNDEEQVLLLRHRFHNTRMWGLPGGWLTPGETIYDCWRRELKEELALETSVEAIVCHRATRHILEFYLVGRIDGGEMRIDPVEILEARFFAADRLPPMESFSRQVIRKAVSQVEAMESKRVGRTDDRHGGTSRETASVESTSSRGEEPVEVAHKEEDTPRA